MLAPCAVTGALYITTYQHMLGVLSMQGRPCQWHTATRGLRSQATNHNHYPYLARSLPPPLAFSLTAVPPEGAEGPPAPPARCRAEPKRKDQTQGQQQSRNYTFIGKECGNTPHQHLFPKGKYASAKTKHLHACQKKTCNCVDMK